MSRQTDRVMEYISTFGSITALEAMRDIGVMRLSGRICDLQRKGVRIYKARESVLNRYGEKCWIVRYSLEDPLQKQQFTQEEPKRNRDFAAKN